MVDNPYTATASCQLPISEQSSHELSKIFPDISENENPRASQSANEFRSFSRNSPCPAFPVPELCGENGRIMTL